MKAVCLQENLKNALNLTSRNVASQPQLPILANILLKAEKNKIRLSSTNLSLSINLWINAKIEKEGETTLPAKIVTEFINSLPPGKIQLTLQKDKLLIASSQFKATFNTLSAADFPSLPTLAKTRKKKKASSFFVPAKKLFRAISQTAFAAATDESRPVLTGVLWRIDQKRINLVATDGYRLSLKQLKLKNAPKIPQNDFIIPAITLQEISRMEGEKEQIEILLDPQGKQIIFSLDSLEIISQLLEGEYPDFTKIIPEKGETIALLDREEFFQAVQISAIFARESANLIKFKINESQLKISANTPQLGANESVLPIKVNGQPNQIAFNSRFVLDFLKSVSSADIEIEIIDSVSPAIFRPVVKEKNYQHIIMPVRVQEES